MMFTYEVVSVIESPWLHADVEVNSEKLFKATYPGADKTKVVGVLTTAATLKTIDPEMVEGALVALDKMEAQRAAG